MDSTDERRPAAWYPDPARDHEMRYWDGNAWTEHVADAGTTSKAPPASAMAAPIPLPTSTLACSVTQAVLQRAQYLGGHPDLNQAVSGTLYVTRHLIGVGAIVHLKGYTEPIVRMTIALNMADVRSIDVSSETVAKSKFGAVAVFGVLGGLSAKGSKTQTYVTVHMKDGEVAYFRVDEVAANEVRAATVPILRAAGVAFHDEIGPSGAPRASVADELAKLAQLRDAGVLSAEEFEAQKHKLLAL